MTKDEALKLALDALEESTDTERTYESFERGDIAITAIKDVLAQPSDSVEPTPEQLAALGWQSIECPFCGTSGAQAFPKPECDWEGIAADQAMTIALMKSEQPEQEPVVWLTNDERAAFERFNETCEDGEGYDVAKKMMNRLEVIGVVHLLGGGVYSMTEFGHWVLDNTTPPKREWVGLTEMDIRNIFPYASYPLFLKTVSAIEAKLKELNHG